VKGNQLFHKKPAHEINTVVISINIQLRSLAGTGMNQLSELKIIMENKAALLQDKVGKWYWLDIS
jgi:hypothetical protein